MDRELEKLPAAASGCEYDARHDGRVVHLDDRLPTVRLDLAGAADVVQPIGTKGHRGTEANSRRKSSGAHEAQRAVRRDDAAVVEKDDAAAEALRFFHVVSAVQDGRTVFREARDGIEDPLARLGIDADGRFIQENDARPMEDSAREIQAAEHPPGETVDGLVGAPFESDERQGLVGRPPRLAAAEALQAREEREVLPRRERWVDGYLLRDEADRSPRFPRGSRQRVIRDDRRSAVSDAERGEDRKRRRLPCPVRSEKTDDLAGSNLETDAGERRAITVALDETVDDDRRMHARSISGSRRAIHRRSGL